MWQCLQTFWCHAGVGGRAGIWWEESRDQLSSLQCTEQLPPHSQRSDRESLVPEHQQCQGYETLLKQALKEAVTDGTQEQRQARVSRSGVLGPVQT